VVAEVEVDPGTGQVKVKTDDGPRLRQPSIGGVVTGSGLLLLMEDNSLVDGKMMTANPANPKWRQSRTPKPHHSIDARRHWANLHQGK